MDRITENLINDFTQKFELPSSIAESTKFEMFVNYSIVKNEFNNEFNIDNISTDKNQGIDGLAIIVNNQFISSIDEIREIIDKEKKLYVDFIFIQSKTSDKFESTEIGNFLFTIKDFLNSKPQLPMTPELRDKFNIKEEIFNNFKLMAKGSPNCKVFYTTLGKWGNEKPLKAVIDRNKKEIVDMALFEKVDFFPIDARSIQKLYRRTSEAADAEFTFASSPVNIPNIKGVDEAYLGLVSFSEYKKLIIDENDKIKNVFYDNIRDYLGENNINVKIDQTLKNKNFDLFALLNNGITVVADKKDSSKGNSFYISNYQIVNGCQTSHTLYKNRNIKNIDNVNIPLKLIITNNEDIKTRITISTNSQTAITNEQLIAFSEFQKTLEQFYKSFDSNMKLYYERRTGQYDSDQKIIKSKIITIKYQIKSFSSMFFGIPHLASGYYGKLFQSVEPRIFKSDHQLLPYFVSSFLLYKIEKFLRSDTDKIYNKFRYHILLLYRIIVCGNSIPKLNSKKILKPCEKIIETLTTDESFIEVFNKIKNIVLKSGIDINNQKILYQKNTTDILIHTATQEK